VRYPASVQTDNAAGEGTLFDLSATGCRMQSTVTMQAGTYLALHIDAPEEPVPLAVEVSVVRWCRDGQFGIEFLRYANGDRTRVTQLVEELPLAVAPAEPAYEEPVLATA
jgi:hypothetical protein